jgi:hypothetical protein
MCREIECDEGRDGGRRIDSQSGCSSDKATCQKDKEGVGPCCSQLKIECLEKKKKRAFFEAIVVG